MKFSSITSRVVPFISDTIALSSFNILFKSVDFPEFGGPAIVIGIPFLIAAGFTGFFLSRMKLLRKLSRPFQFLTGIIMILMGIAMITGYFSSLGYILIEFFPELANIG